MNRHSTSRLSVAPALGAALLFLTAGLWLAAALTVLILDATAASGGPLHAYLLEKGPEKLMRRCLLGVGLVFLLGFLKRAGWGGWRDCGFATRDPDRAGRSVLSDLLQGLALGVLSLGLVGGLTILARIHPVVIALSPGAMGLEVAGLLASGLAVALVEETAVRGILFRVLARAWRPWPAALLSSAIFAAAHFVEPARAAFEPGSFWAMSGRAYRSIFSSFSFWDTPLSAVKFANLFLLGVVLCAFVIRTRTIWLAVGAHAGWVWMIKLHGLLTQYDPAAPLAAWIGRRNDFMDSVLATAILGLLLAWAAARAPHAGVPLRRRGIAWRVAPEQRDRFAAWLGDGAGTDPMPGEQVLKAYPGCRVVRRGGVVLKTRRALPGPGGWRFALRPSRARHAFLTAHRLAARGIPTPTPLAWAVRRRLGLLRADYGAAAELADTEPLDTWLARPDTDPALRARVVGAYGRLMAGFHRAGYSNRDLKHENVLCDRAQPWRLWVVDLDGVRRRPWLTRRRAGRDLRRAGLSLAPGGNPARADTAAFFEAYNAAVPARLRRGAFPPP